MIKVVVYICCYSKISSFVHTNTYNKLSQSILILDKGQVIFCYIRRNVSSCCYIRKQTFKKFKMLINLLNESLAQ